MPGLFIRDQSGTAALEFAFIAIPLCTLLYASVMMSVIYFTQDALDFVADQMSRPLLTGTAPSSSAAFKTQACTQLPSYLSCSSLYVNVQTVTTFAQPSITPTYDSSDQISNKLNYEPGSPGDIVALQLMYRLPIPTVAGLGGFNPVTQGAGQSLLLLSTVVIKTEPAS